MNRVTEPKRTKEHPRPSCMVFLDGMPIMVPVRVTSWYELRGALGIVRGMGVAHFDLGVQTWMRLKADDLDDHDGAGTWWDFVENDQYRTASFLSDEFGVTGFDQPPEHREPWQRDDDWWKRADGWA